MHFFSWCRHSLFLLLHIYQYSCHIVCSNAIIGGRGAAVFEQNLERRAHVAVSGLLFDLLAEEVHAALIILAVPNAVAGHNYEFIVRQIPLVALNIWHAGDRLLLWWLTLPVLVLKVANGSTKCEVAIHPVVLHKVPTFFNPFLFLFILGFVIEAQRNGSPFGTKYSPAVSRICTIYCVLGNKHNARCRPSHICVLLLADILIELEKCCFQGCFVIALL